MRGGRGLGTRLGSANRSSPIRRENSPGTCNIVVPYTSYAALQWISFLSEVHIPSKTMGRKSIQWSAFG